MYNACPLGIGILTDAGERIATPACKLVWQSVLNLLALTMQHRTGQAQRMRDTCRTKVSKL